MPKKILVVEDDADTRDVLVTLLLLEGFDVVTARDGEEGLNLAKAAAPDLIITDINMPGLSGTEMIKRLRLDPALGSLPVVALTAHGREGRSSAAQAGADRVMAKPIEYDLFIEEIGVLLG